MKKPELHFKKVYYVTSWSEEVVSGLGAALPPFNMSLSTYENRVLFYPESTDACVMVVSKNDIYNSLKEAERRVSSERADKIRYYTNSKMECEDKIKRLTL